MEGLYKIGYLLLMGVLIFSMFRRGGCCGHGHSGGRRKGSNADGSHNHGGSA